MANSCSRFRPGFFPFQRSASSPGPLGHNDAASPDLAFLGLSDSPGILGFNDHASPDATSKEGTAMPDSTDTAAGSLSVEQAQELSLRITTFFEGGISMNFCALADDFDGQGTSFGLIQWNFGQNTLGPLLKKMLESDAVAFSACFGPEAKFEDLKAALVTSNQGKQLQWARDLLKKNRSSWESVFKKLGEVPQFCKIQQQYAAQQYHPKVLATVTSLRNMCPGQFGKLEFRSYAALFDLCVQQGSIQKALNQIQSGIKTAKPTSQLDVMKIVVVERGLTASSAWASDCISRRMGILLGYSYKSSHNGKERERRNPQLSLISEYGSRYVTGL